MVAAAVKWFVRFRPRGRKVAAAAVKWFLRFRRRGRKVDAAVVKWFVRFKPRGRKVAAAAVKWFVRFGPSAGTGAAAAVKWFVRFRPRGRKMAATAGKWTKFGSQLSKYLVIRQHHDSNECQLKGGRRPRKCTFHFFSLRDSVTRFETLFCQKKTLPSLHMNR